LSAWTRHLAPTRPKREAGTPRPADGHFLSFFFNGGSSTEILYGQSEQQGEGVGSRDRRGFRLSRGPTAGPLGVIRGRCPESPPCSTAALGKSSQLGEDKGPYRLKSRMSLLRAGVDILPCCPAVSLKEKSPAQPPHPPRRSGRITVGHHHRLRDCTNNPAMTSPSAASRSLRPPPLPPSEEWGGRGRDV
jgi:hypothetical protein